MKLSLNWLKDYIDPKISTDALIERLTMAGLEVESLDYIAGDTVLEIEITPNRPDCLSILGLAREIGAITGKRVKLPKIKNFKTATLKNLVHVEDKKDCSRYIGTLIRDVHIAPVSEEIKKRLIPLGMKPISNAVDVTNFVLMETSQPLHVFDYDKLAGGKIIVRRAKAGESIVTLDGIERKLDPSILVIADTQKPVAIAGIMGGRNTEITTETKNILLESAQFDMGLIRAASRKLALRSDSSYRFERNVNFEGVLIAANRATELLLQLTGGQLAGRGAIAVKVTKTARKISVRISDIESLLGMAVSAAKVKTWLGKLGFKISPKAGALSVVAPANRTDIQRDVDVIEEIARMIGFDRVPLKMPVIKSANIPVDKRPQEIKENIRRVLTAAGLNETITLTMLNAKALAKSNMGEMPSIRIFNPLSQDQEVMRPGLLPSLLQVASTNFNRAQKDLRFFEIGKTYLKDKEKETLGILLTGRQVDFFHLKGLMERSFEKLGINATYVATQMPAFAPGAAANIIIDGKTLGILGKVSTNVLNNWEIKPQDIYYAALYLDEIFTLPVKSIRYQPISEFPAIVRDVSLAVKKEIPYQRIQELCQQQGGEILRGINFIEQYTGDKIQPGYKGVVFSCLYQSHARTLREEEVSAVHERIVKTLTQELAVIRR